MKINAKEIIINDLKDKNYSENKEITVSNITAAKEDYHFNFWTDAGFFAREIS